MKKIKRSLLFLAVILALAACGQEDGSTAPVLPESSQADSDSPDSVPAPLPDGSQTAVCSPPRRGSSSRTTHFPHGRAWCAAASPTSGWIPAWRIPVP